MAILREINPNQTGGRGRSGLWTLLRRMDRSKLFSLTFDRGLNLRENGTWNLSQTRLQYWSQENFINNFLSGLRPSLLLGKGLFESLTRIGKSWKTHPVRVENSSKEPPETGRSNDYDVIQDIFSCQK